MRVRVLVVSEDVTTRLRVTTALELFADAVVVEATSAAEARAGLLGGEQDFDVLVVDGDMVPRGGFAVLYALRARAELEQTAPVPSLVLVSREQDRWLGSWAGANDVMLKPADPFQLARRVAALEGAEVAPYGDADSSARQLEAATRHHEADHGVPR